MPDFTVNTQLLSRLQLLIYGLSLTPPEIPAGETESSLEDKIWAVAEQVLSAQKLKQVRLDDEPLLALNLALLELSQQKIESMYGILKVLVDQYDQHLREQEQEAQKLRRKAPTAHQKMLSQLDLIRKTVAKSDPAAATLLENVQSLVFLRLATHPDSLPVPDLVRIIDRTGPPSATLSLVAPLADSLTFVYPDLSRQIQTLRDSVVTPLGLPPDSSAVLADSLFTEHLSHPLADPQQAVTRLSPTLTALKLTSSQISQVSAALPAFYSAAQFKEVSSRLLSLTPVPESDQSQILYELPILLGTPPSSLPDKISQTVSSATSVFVQPEIITALAQIAEIYDPQAPPILQILRTPLLRYIHATVPVSPTEISLPRETLTQIKQALVSSLETVPDRSPESLVLRSIQPLLVAQLAVSPQTTIPAAVDLIMSSSPDKNTLPVAVSLLAPALPALLPLHPDLAAFHSLILSRLSQTGLDTGILVPIATGLTLYKVSHPAASTDELNRHLNRTVLPQLEAKRLISHPETLIGQLSQYVGGYDFYLRGDAALLQYLTFQFQLTGLTSDAAKRLAQKALPTLKAAYYLSGFSSDPNSFRQLFPFALNHLESQPSLQSLFRGLRLDNLNPDLTADQLLRQYGPAPSLNPQEHLGQTSRPGPLSDLLRHLADQPIDRVKGPVAELLQRFAASPAGKQFFASPVGRQIYTLFTKSGLTRLAPSAFRVSRLASHPYTLMGRRLLAPVTSLAKSVFSKIAQTAIGKTISAITSKIVTQLGLQTALQAIGTTVAPVIGNIIAFVVGLVVDATIGLAVRTFKKLKEYAPMLIGALVGLTTSAFAGFGATGIALSTGIGAITGAGLQSFFTGSGPATGFLTSTVQVIGGLILGIPEVIISSIFLPIIVIILVVPVVIAFFMFIINSGAYVVPISPGFNPPMIFPGISGAPTNVVACIPGQDYQPLPFPPPTGNDIAFRSYQIVGGIPADSTNPDNPNETEGSGLRCGFWAIWNRSPQYDDAGDPYDFFSEDQFARDPNHCVYYDNFPAGCTGSASEPINLFWCTYNVILSYRDTGHDIPFDWQGNGDMVGAQTMRKWFQAQGRYLTAQEALQDPIANIQPGDVVIIHTPVSSADVAHHVSIVYDVTIDYIRTMDSNAADKTFTYTIATDRSGATAGSFYVLGIGKQW